MWAECFWSYEDTENQNDFLSKQKGVFDLKWYAIELRNKQERMQLLEAREKELEWLEDLLEQNPNTQSFYIREWRYYPNNPLNLLDAIYLSIETREETQERVNILKESLAEDKIIQITQKLDKLINGTFR